jgi:hypothetical protein
VLGARWASQCWRQGLHLDKAAARLEQAGPKHSPRAPRLADTAEGRAFGYLSLLRSETCSGRKPAQVGDLRAA